MQYPHVIAGFVVFCFRNDSEVLANFTERFSHRNFRPAINHERSYNSVQGGDSFALKIQLHSLQ